MNRRNDVAKNDTDEDVGVDTIDADGEEEDGDKKPSAVIQSKNEKKNRRAQHESS